MSGGGEFEHNEGGINLHWVNSGLTGLTLSETSGAVASFQQNLKGSTPPLQCPSLSLPSPLEVGPLNPAMGSGERCKLTHRGLGRSPSRNRIWCILVLKSDIWWQQ